MPRSLTSVPEDELESVRIGDYFYQTANESDDLETVMVEVIAIHDGSAIMRNIMTETTRSVDLKLIEDWTKVIRDV